MTMIQGGYNVTQAVTIAQTRMMATKFWKSFGNKANRACWCLEVVCERNNGVKRCSKVFGLSYRKKGIVATD